MRRSVNYRIPLCCKGLGWWNSHYWSFNFGWLPNPLCVEWLRSRFSGDCCAYSSPKTITSFWGVAWSFGLTRGILTTLEVATQNLVISKNFTKMKQFPQEESHLWSFKQTSSHRGPQGSQPGHNSNGAQRDGHCSNCNSGQPNNSNRHY